MSSPWDGPDREVTVLRGEEHDIIGVSVSPPVTGDDDRFSIEFRTVGNRVLCVRLPIDVLQSLADVLHELVNEQERGDDDARESRELIT
jgi:hypothetical protein